MLDMLEHMLSFLKTSIPPSRLARAVHALQRDALRERASDALARVSLARTTFVGTPPVTVITCGRLHLDPPPPDR